MTYAYQVQQEKMTFCNNKKVLINALEKRIEPDSLQKINKWIDGLDAEFNGLIEYYIDEEKSLFVAAIR